MRISVKRSRQRRENAAENGRQKNPKRSTRIRGEGSSLARESSLAPAPRAGVSVYRDLASCWIRLPWASRSSTLVNARHGSRQEFRASPRTRYWPFWQLTAVNRTYTSNRCISASLAGYEPRFIGRPPIVDPRRARRSTRWQSIEPTLNLSNRCTVHSRLGVTNGCSTGLRTPPGEMAARSPFTFTPQAVPATGLSQRRFEARGTRVAVEVSGSARTGCGTEYVGARCSSTSGSIGRKAAEDPIVSTLFINVATFYIDRDLPERRC